MQQQRGLDTGNVFRCRLALVSFFCAAANVRFGKTGGWSPLIGPKQFFACWSCSATQLSKTDLSHRSFISIGQKIFQYGVEQGWLLQMRRVGAPGKDC